jgi:DeoR/GlpR family transcriptional regulator of sugar metabolism
MAKMKLLGDYLLEDGFPPTRLEEALKNQLGFHKNGKHLPIGTILRKLGASDDEIESAAMRLEQDRLMSLDPVTQFSPSTKFGSRLRDNEIAKKRVAEETAQLWARPQGALFIADGTSGFYTFLAVVRRMERESKEIENHSIEIRTNSLAIAMEYSQSATISRRVKLNLVGTKPLHSQRNEYLALGGDPKCFETACLNRVAVLPVTRMTFRNGPWAHDDEIKEIKWSIMHSAARTIFVADHSKLGPPATNNVSLSSMSPVFENEKDWQKWRFERTWHFVVSRHPKVRGLTNGQYDPQKKDESDYVSEISYFLHEFKGEPGQIVEIKP